MIVLLAAWGSSQNSASWMEHTSLIRIGRTRRTYRGHREVVPELVRIGRDGDQSLRL